MVVLMKTMLMVSSTGVCVCVCVCVCEYIRVYMYNFTICLIISLLYDVEQYVTQISSSRSVN